MATSPFLIVGLGNPGAQYEHTRHNVGFMALEHFADSLGTAAWQEKFNGRFCRCRLGEHTVLLAEPLTFMNRSGQFVAPLTRYFKIALANMLVLHDDLDLDPGRIKVVARGGSGGHNGIRSLIAELGSSDFARVKIGIGRPEKNEKGYAIPIERYVLSRFSRQEEEQLETLFTRTDRAQELFVREGIAACMNVVNRR